MISYAMRVERGTGGDDRAAVVVCSDVTLIVVADGAGGTGGGGEAAEAICARVTEAARRGVRGAEAWATCLSDADREAAEVGIIGESTAVVVEVSREAISGASVGDSEAWVVSGTAVVEVSRGQERKPLIGSGRARPARFGPATFDGRLLVATDGLFKYAAAGTLANVARGAELEDAANGLLACVRLRSGALPDDVALVLAERAG